MNEYAAEFRRCLVGLDIAGIKAIWGHAFPNMPQPSSDEQALLCLHMARTQAKSIQFPLRAYSHRWLTERGYPSQLPDELKPSAERMYPVVVTAVGISVNYTAKHLKPAGKLIEKAIAATIEDAYANGDTEPDLIKTLIEETSQRERKKLFG